MFYNRCYSRRPDTSSIRGSICSLSLWLLICSISPSLAYNVSCCPEGTRWERSMNCSDGTKVFLDCPDGAYMMDPNLHPYDKFIVSKDKDGLFWLVQESKRTAQDRFCISTSVEDGHMIALSCFDDDDEESMPLVWKGTLILIVSIISAIFLIATLAVYVMLPELRELQDKAMMATVTTLAVSYTVLSIQNLNPVIDANHHICVSFGFILYFAFMCAFFWLNIVAFNIWRCVWFKNFRVQEKLLFYIYCVWGWGVPTCFLVTALTTHHMQGEHIRPGFGDRSCWFSGTVQTWAYFYGPIAILLAMNTIYLGLTSWRLWHQYRNYNGSKLRILRFKCLLYIKLVLVMGITWIFELISSADTNNDELWIPTDILNGLQGFIIFLLLVVTRKRVRKLLAKKRPCGIAFPKSWAAYEDEECEEVLPEELELSQQG